MVELIIGGSSSGKSEYAEKQILALPVRIPRYYVAAMAADDPESRARIRKHQLRRQNMNFITVEQPVDIENSLRQMCHGRKIILLECLTNLVANEMFGRLNPQTSDPAGIAEKICNGLSRLISPETDLFAVTDNVFEDGMIYDEMTEHYRAVLGKVSRWMAAKADIVTEAAAGIPIQVKGKSAVSPERRIGEAAGNTEQEKREAAGNTEQEKREAAGNTEQEKREAADSLIQEKGSLRRCPIGVNHMILIIGGSYQGKTEYAGSHYAGRPQLVHLEQQVRKELQQGKTKEDILTCIFAYIDQNPGCVVICDEAGSGIVPLDAFERKYRDVLGEILMKLAARAEEVIRVICGIGQVLKTNIE